MTHGDDGLLLYTINAPEAADDDDDEDVSAKLLEAISAHGHQGVRTWKAVRGLLKVAGKKVDAALEDLLKQGLVVKTQDGRASIFVATPEGRSMLDVGE